MADEQISSIPQEPANDKLGSPASTRPLSRPAGLTQVKINQPRPPVKHRWKRITLIAALVILVLGSALSIGGYIGLYAPARQLAADGAKHLQKAQNLVMDLAYHPLASKTLIQARDEFSAAERDFQGVNTRLSLMGPVLGMIGFFTGRSDEIHSYEHLAHMALDLSSAGRQALDVGLFLISKEQNAFQAPGGSGTALADHGLQPAVADHAQAASSLSASDIARIQQVARNVVALVEDAWQEAQGVTLTALPANSSIQAAVTLFRNEYPGLHQFLGALQGAFEAAPKLFGIGKSTTYLAEWMDTSERRGAGGLITAYGALSVQNGQLVTFTLRDTYLLDTPYQASHTTPIPAEDSWFPLTNNWGLRDSSLEPDFPTAAKSAEQLYTAEGGGPAVDGVIAFTTSFFEHVLTITGPVQIPELNEVIDETNLTDRLHFYQFPRSKGDEVSPAALNSPKGRFPALFSKYLLEKLRQLTPQAAIAVLQEAVLAQSTKDLQLYLNDPHAQQALLQGHRASAVEAPAGDAIFIVDTNISGNKANDNIDQAMQDSIALDDQGNAIHHLLIAYAWRRSAPVYGSSTYSDYVRIYVPANSQLQGYTGFSTFGTSAAYGHTIWHGTFQLTYGQKVLLSLTYVVPHAVQDQHDQLHYALLVQRQACNPLSRLQLTIGLPQGSTLAQHSGNLHLSPNSASALLLNQLLDRDTTVTVDYE